MTPKKLSLSTDASSVSALWINPPKAKALLVLAHGAGAGMNHKSMTAIAEGLAERGIATLRFNFPYMERGSKRPDSPAIAHATIRAAVAKAIELSPKLPLFAGGKSFGGRMTSQAQDADPLPKVEGLVFFGFPLHPAGAPSITRADHLAKIDIPMLFLQGTRDALADLPVLKGVTKKLGKRATLILANDADHSFHVPKSSGRTDDVVLGTLSDAARAWMLASATRT
jgi:predicted alpha/beta-hydrolase family hydrolase